MNPISENSLPYTGSDNSARGARNGRNTTASSVSDLFGSGLQGSVKLRNFSSPRPMMPRGKNPDPDRYIAERLSPVPSSAGIRHLEPDTTYIGDDQAISEWETVAADDAFEVHPQVPARPLRRQGNFNFVFNPQDKSQTNQNVWTPQTQSFELVSRQDPAFQASVRLVPRSTPRLRSFHSSSSFYSDLDRNGEPSRVEYHNAQRNNPAVNEREIAPAETRSQETLKRLSQATDDSDEDPFKYDSDKYSGFLRSSAERENVDEEVKVPVHREENKEVCRLPVPAPDRRLTGEIATLVKNRPQTGTEGDWQTVTTENPYDSMQQEYHDSIAKGTGSSVADFSDVTERELHPHSYCSTDKIIRHPHGSSGLPSYHVRTDRGTNHRVFVPQYGVPGTFAQNTARSFVQPISKLPESAARLSSLFRRAPVQQTPNRESILLADLPPQRGSYQSLDSDAVPREIHNATDSASPEATQYFRWSRIRKNLGREPPQVPLTILDQPLYRRGIQEPDEASKPAHVPHDDFLSKLPKLPFPLVSLPEAAMLQQFRRQRGEEDHTEPAKVFAAKSRSNTISTANSPGIPKTPSPHKGFWATSPGPGIARPPPAHHPQRVNQAFCSRDSSERISDMLASSSAILDTPPATVPRSGMKRGWYRGLQQGLLTPQNEQPKIHGFYPSLKDRRVDRNLSIDGSPFTQAETELIDAARQEILLHRQRADMVAKRGKRVFMWIMILSLLFPFIGPVVLYGKLNSTISWYTHGEMRCLTKDQRGTLKQQLLVEAFVYPVIIISLSVYYSVRK
ncbi:hypothetical protein F66182_3755 [Fusarium sp. NRRL 66182]|nr:hypothetical protein F66182_3755 [Fusarium sp. NRRL 66182]